MSADGQRTKWCRNIAENFNRLSRAVRAAIYGQLVRPVRPLRLAPTVSTVSLTVRNFCSRAKNPYGQYGQHGLAHGQPTGSVIQALPVLHAAKHRRINVVTCGGGAFERPKTARGGVCGGVSIFPERSRILFYFCR